MLNPPSNDIPELLFEVFPPKCPTLQDAQEWRECVSFYRKLMSSFLQLPSLSHVCELDILDLLQMLIIGLPELHLVGGSGPHEGNILVGGRPVCDDGHNAQNALVVCRFPFLSWCNDIKQATEKNDYFVELQMSRHPGCWATPPASQPTGRTSARWRPTSRWTTCSALAMRPLSLTVPISRCVTLIINLVSFIFISYYF